MPANRLAQGVGRRPVASLSRVLALVDQGSYLIGQTLPIVDRVLQSQPQHPIRIEHRIEQTTPLQRI